MVFPRLYRETARHPDNKRLLDELGAHYLSTLIPPRRTKYSWETPDGSDFTPRQERTSSWTTSTMTNGTKTAKSSTTTKTG